MEYTDGRRNSGIDSAPVKRFFKSKRGKLITALVCIALVLAYTAAILAVLRGQERKLAEISDKNNALTEEQESLERELERLQGQLEYVNSMEGLLLYAREYLGYVDPNDIIINPDGN